MLLKQHPIFQYCSNTAISERGRTGLSVGVVMCLHDTGGVATEIIRTYQRLQTLGVQVHHLCMAQALD
jgi:hypothetical protein